MIINFVGIWSSLFDLFTFNCFNSAATSLEVGGNKAIEDVTLFLGKKSEKQMFVCLEIVCAQYLQKTY